MNADYETRKSDGDRCSSRWRCVDPYRISTGVRIQTIREEVTEIGARRDGDDDRYQRSIVVRMHTIDRCSWKQRCVDRYRRSTSSDYQRTETGARGDGDVDRYRSS
ncbi:hypothetical protein M5689_011215 [Euphorbia peplus]|nr:hypothetical protein M5689_011215 [Euphorbia peplus]